jgi:hypothetical protein
MKPVAAPSISHGEEPRRPRRMSPAVTRPW